MQDTIILGNGTSKQIKTASLPNSYAEFKALAENGNLFADIKLNADGCEVVGTPLNKLNLLTDETASKIGNPENIDKAIENLHSTINGIPVDLTGIYNTQVIGFDETQGKLVPMINVARTEQIIPNYITPVPWTISIVDIPSWMDVVLTDTNRPQIENTTRSSTVSEPVNFYVVSNKNYMISEFTTLNIAAASKNINKNSVIVELSKTPDFSNIEASYNLTASNIVVKCDITSLKGNYYWRLKFEGNTLTTAYNVGNVYFYINELYFS